MEEKRERGRPAGRLYQHKVFSLLNDQQKAWYDELAAGRGVSHAELFRRMIEEEARRKGLKKSGSE